MNNFKVGDKLIVTGMDFSMNGRICIYKGYFKKSKVRVQFLGDVFDQPFHISYLRKLTKLELALQ